MQAHSTDKNEQKNKRPHEFVAPMPKRSKGDESQSSSSHTQIENIPQVSGKKIADVLSLYTADLFFATNQRVPFSWVIQNCFLELKKNNPKDPMVEDKIVDILCDAAFKEFADNIVQQAAPAANKNFYLIEACLLASITGIEQAKKFMQLINSNQNVAFFISEMHFFLGKLICKDNQLQVARIAGNYGQFFILYQMNVLDIIPLDIKLEQKITEDRLANRLNVENAVSWIIENFFWNKITTKITARLLSYTAIKNLLKEEIITISEIQFLFFWVKNSDFIRVMADVLDNDPSAKVLKKQQSKHFMFWCLRNVNLAMQSSGSKTFQPFANPNEIVPNHLAVEVKKIPLNELRQPMKKIGAGGFSEVFLGEWQAEGEMKKVVVKKIQGNLNFNYTTEVFILAKLQSIFVPKLYGVTIEIKDHKVIYGIILEYMEQGSLDKILRQHANVLLEKILESYAQQIAKALRFIHGQGFLHCDLKSENVLIDRHNQAKITDFGLSSPKEIKPKPCGTQYWCAPEISLENTSNYHTTETDIYSFGMLLWELAARKKPFIDAMLSADAATADQSTQRQCFSRLIIQGIRPAIPAMCSIAYNSLITSCWHQDPKSRPTLNNIIKTLTKSTFTLFKANSIEKTPTLLPARSKRNKM
jgi:hypothetical protein